MNIKSYLNKNMAYYENTIVAKQDLSESEINKIRENIQ